MKITRHGFAIIGNDSHIGRWAEESGRLDHDQNMLPRVLQYIPEGGFVIDAGGYIGDHTVAYADKVGPSGGVVAFEPYKSAYECLKYNMKNYKNVVCEFAALGAKEGYTSMSCEIENFGMATTSDGDEVEVTTLDTRFKHLKKIDFIKIDVEGLEIDVLEGGKEVISKHRPIMLIEVNEHTLRVKGHTKNDLLKAISDLGYTYRNVYEGQGIKDDQFDVICFPR